MSLLYYLAPLLLINPVDETHTDHELRWGQIGHYVTGEIAEKYLTGQAAGEVRRVLGNTSVGFNSLSTFF